MPKDRFSCRCRNCGGELSIERMTCGECGLTIEGRIALPRLARLSPEDREFIELFVLSAGSLKEVGKTLKLSYPTVRARLDRVIADLHELNEKQRDTRMEIIRKLEARRNHGGTGRPGTRKKPLNRKERKRWRLLCVSMKL